MVRRGSRGIAGPGSCARSPRVAPEVPRWTGAGQGQVPEEAGPRVCVHEHRCARVGAEEESLKKRNKGRKRKRFYYTGCCNYVSK